MHIGKANKYLRDVAVKHQRVPSRRYNGGVGCCAQAKQLGWTQGRLPKKSAELLLHMLKKVESNAGLKGLDVDSLVIEAPKMRQSPRSHQTLHEVIVPHQDDPDGEGADCLQTRGGGFTEEADGRKKNKKKQ